jgi:hypothetical protein
MLSRNTNPRAIRLIKKCLEDGDPGQKAIHWEQLSRNPAAIEILEKNQDKICWRSLSENPAAAAIKILEQNQGNICWRSLSENPAAIPLLEHNPDKIDWRRLSQNPAAIHILLQNPEMISWDSVAYNPNAAQIYERYPDKINVTSVKYLKYNRFAIPFLTKILEKNPELVKEVRILPHVLLQHADPAFIDKYLADIKKTEEYWISYSRNPAIFELDYRVLETRCNIYKHELVRKTMHPKRLEKYLEMGYDLEETLGFL